MTARTLVALGALALSGCMTMQPANPPAPVQGTYSLAGVWEGTYESRETGRGGRVFFALSADADTARGQIVMAPLSSEVTVRPVGEQWAWDGVPIQQVLTIQILRLGSRDVVGELDPYLDPRCGCTLRTTFRGTVAGDTVAGTFESQADEPDHDATGTWRATRRSG